MSPFDIVQHVCSSKVNNWDEHATDYVPFLTNRALSYNVDTVMLAAEMSFRHQLPPEQQYAFYLNAITPKKKRFSKWAKQEKDDDINIVMSAYQVTRRKAIDILTCINKDDIKFIHEKMNYGGTK